MLVKIDFSNLADLRVDYAFKLLFSEGDPRLLISLLNAIFSNKKIPRVVKSVTVQNPFLDKYTMDDKLSILDIKAVLDDGTNILVEMHMHDMSEIKPKTIRSWARTHSTELKEGESYISQPPTISIAFIDGAVSDSNKIHTLCKIMDCEDHTVFTDAMELHYINMKAFVKSVNKAGSINIKDTEEEMFAKWLSIITQKEIKHKSIIENSCKEEVIQMAVTTMMRQLEDEHVMRNYLRRQAEIESFNRHTALREKAEREIVQYKLEIKQQKREIAQQKRESAQHKREKEQAEAEIKKLLQQIAELQTNQNPVT